MSVRQSLNRSFLFGRKSKARGTGADAPAPARTATAGKRSFPWTHLLLVVFVPMFLLLGIVISAIFVGRTAHVVESPLAAADEPSAARLGADDSISRDEARDEAIMRRATERVLEDFRADRQRVALWPDSELWPTRRVDEEQARRIIALLLLMLCIANACVALGMANRDLGAVEWKFEWLFSFPASNTTLLFAKVCEYAAYNPFCFFTCFPVILVVGLADGLPWWGAVFKGVVGTICVSTVLASLRLFVETYLRKRCSLTRTKSLQALFTVAGLVLFYLVLYAAVLDAPPRWFYHVAAADLSWADYLPTTLPVRPGLDGMYVALLLVAAIPLGVLGAALTSLLVRDGLVTTGGGAYVGSRGKVAPPARGALAAVRGIAGKELRLLSRDRNFLVRALVLPLIIISFQVAVNPALLDGATEKPQHAAMLAFSVVAYALAGSALMVLAYESRTLWLLYSFPQGLANLMLQKAKLWAVIAMIYVICIGEGLLLLGKTTDLGAHGFVLLAAVGIGIYSFIAAGIGTLGCDPLAQDERKRLKSGPVLFYLFLAGQFSFAMYEPSLWKKFVFTLLSVLVAYALWQRVRARGPYLLDPESQPPARIALSDGLIVTMAFFVIQGVLTQFVSRLVPPEDALLSVVVAYGAAGVIVTGLAIGAFVLRKVPDLWATLGLVRTRWSLARSLAVGPCLGLLSGGVAFLYLKIGKSRPWFAEQLEKMEGQGAGFVEQGWLWLVVLAVFVAPLCEEFLFRALIYRGLRQSSRFAVAAVASAAIFAVVHPPLAFIPVFVLGVVSAWGFERSGSIMTSVTAHMVHNMIALTVVMAGWV